MTYEFFPGANTPDGFASRFDTLLADAQIRHRVYIKGGPGCGKSTLMRRLSGLARERGFDTTEGLCSSDPDSLDLLLIPGAGFAICDATAPHVCEPSLCGCDGVYCDLGRFYVPDVYEHIFVLKSLQQENKACYAPATQALAAARALYRQRTALINAESARPRLRNAATRLAARLLERRSGGAVTALFLTGVTPRGCVSRFDLPAKTVYLLRDSYHLAGVYLRHLLELGRDAGHRIVAGYSPLFPDEGPEQLYFPDAGLLFVRQSSHFLPRLSGSHVIDLDEMVSENADTRAETVHLQALTGQILDTAVGHLHRAKTLHDELEAALHPYVDFAGINRVGTQLAEKLTALLDATPHTP